MEEGAVAGSPGREKLGSSRNGTPQPARHIRRPAKFAQGLGAPRTP